MLIFNQFRRVQWKLALSFAIVTVCVMTIINIGDTARAVYNASSEGLSVDQIYERIAPFVEQTSHYLKAEPPDLEQLDLWANQLLMSTELLVPFDEGPSVMMIPTIEYILIFDTDGLLLVEQQYQGAGLIVSDMITNETQPLLDAALEGEEGLYYTNTELELTTLFLPVRDNDGILGAVVVQILLAPSDINGLISFWPEFYDGFVNWLLASIIIGTLFGYVASYGLVKRLQKLEQSADAWAKGDFSQKVYDDSGDEIGQLARNFNFMADKISMLMSTRAQFAALEERGRMARDLHDTVKQQVFAAQMQLSSVKILLHHDVDAAETILNETLQLNKQTQQDLAELIHALRPVALEEHGLPQAMHRYAAEWSTRSGVSTELFTQNEQPLPLTSEYALYRIVQEALANVAKHAQAKQVTIQLNWQAKQIILKIQDDGVGFDVSSQHKKGYGLRSMNERLAELGGQVTIESMVGEGTTVIATLPIAKEG